MFVQVVQEVLAPLYWVLFALPNMSKGGNEKWLVGLFMQLTKREGSTMRTPMPRIAISSGPSARLVLPNMSFSSTISGQMCLLVELSGFAKIAFLHAKGKLVSGTDQADLLGTRRPLRRLATECSKTSLLTFCNSGNKFNTFDVVCDYLLIWLDTIL